MSVASLFWLTVQVAMFSVVGAAIFLLLRRRGPSAAAACAATVLMLTLPLLAISLSPWPRWEIAAKPQAPAIQTPLKDAVLHLDTEVDELTTFEIVDSPVEEAPQESAVAALWRKAGELLQAPQQPAENATVSEPPAWRTWLPWVMAAGVAIGIIRLLVGIWAVRSYRGCSTLVDDPELSQTIQQIANELNTQPAEVRETAKLRSAATIGWQRPILLLPADWRSWTETERRVVIAHELAHVARQDYLTVVIARFVTAIHFYQPLVLWLARQLRVQQELAADAWAADVTGSRQTYLTTLAQMALRADEQTIPWPARAFLPRTGLLLKRVTWLKRNKTKEEQAMKRRSRWILAATMAAVALFVAGIRGPNESVSTVKAAEPAAETPKQSFPGITAPTDFIGTTDSTLAQAAGENPAGGEGIVGLGPPDTLVIPKHRSAEYIPADAKMIQGLSAAQFAKFPQIAKFFEFIDQVSFEELFGVPLRDLDDIVAVKVGPAHTFDRTILRAAKPHDWKKLLGTKLLPKPVAVQVGDKTYYVAGERVHFDVGECAYFPDDRTLVLATEAEMKKIVSGEDKKLDALFEASICSARAIVWADMAFVKSMWKLDRLNGDPITAAVLPVLDKAKWIRFSADISTQTVEPRESGWLSVNADCETAEAAREVAKTADAVRTLVLNVTEMQGKRYAEMVEQTPENKRQMVQVTETLWKLATQILTNTRVQSNERMAFAESRFPLPPDTVAAILLPAVGASREAAMRSQSMNNLKQLALAMHNYHAAFKKMPAAAGIRNNSKHKHSWRVAILPFIEEVDLYNQYHFDEPWDSEHNKQFIAKMPALFRDPHAPKDSTSSSYYMVTGKGTFGDSETGRRFKDITDGTSKTIMLVDAKRDIPWTKPEDIEIDPNPEKPLPNFGGFLQPEGLFVAALADGSVQAISDLADPKWLRALFTVSGGEPAHFREDGPQAFEGRPPMGAVPPSNRNAVARNDSVNNMKMIALAFQNHEDKLKRLPANIRDQNGKPLLSWRVDLLPEVEAGALLKEFRLDEPWDSEHNIKLLDKIPAVYRNPKDDPSSTNASYFMPTGTGTIGNTPRNTLADLSDGTSKTIALVEAKRDIPWTKPEDIEIDLNPAKPLPRFGGFVEGSFVAGFGDGHVSLISDAADPALLRAFFTIAGREVVDENKITAPQPGGPKAGVQKPGVEPQAIGPRPPMGAAPPANRNAAGNNASVKNLKMIALASLMHEDKYKRLPANICDKNGKPLLSWRVRILPDIEQEALYKEFRLDEPWDSEHNMKLVSKLPSVYRSPAADPKSTASSYYMPVAVGKRGGAPGLRPAPAAAGPGETAAAAGDFTIPAGPAMIGGHQEGLRLAGIPDGTAKTIMLIETNGNTPWTKPEDTEFDLDPTKPLPKLGGFYGGLFYVAFADGSVHPVAQTVDPTVFRAFLTRAGGEHVNEASLMPPKPTAPPNGDLTPNSSKTGSDDNAADRQKKNIVNMKRIGLALHNYLAAKKKFPPAVVVGKDGKTIHSWRVEILPYLEEPTIYDEYRLDEPWDSEHNRKLIAKIPDAFRDPFDAADSTNSSYFMVVGAGNFGGIAEGIRPKNITDGMSNTIMVVEAKRDIPWTRPEDIEVVAGKELPKFGGFIPGGGFLASFADGSVRPIAAEVNGEMLRAFLTYAGGEITNYKALSPAATKPGPSPAEK